MSYEARCVLMMLKQLLKDGRVDEAAIVDLAHKIVEGKHLVPR